MGGCKVPTQACVAPKNKHSNTVIGIIKYSSNDYGAKLKSLRLRRGECEHCGAPDQPPYQPCECQEAEKEARATFLKAASEIEKSGSEDMKETQQLLDESAIPGDMEYYTDGHERATLFTGDWHEEEATECAIQFGLAHWEDFERPDDTEIGRPSWATDTIRPVREKNDNQASIMKQAGGNKAFRRIIDILKKKPDALSRTSWAGRRLDSNKKGLGLMDELPNRQVSDIDEARAAWMRSKSPELSSKLEGGAFDLSDRLALLRNKARDSGRSAATPNFGLRAPTQPANSSAATLLEMQDTIPGSLLSRWRNRKSIAMARRDALNEVAYGLRGSTGIYPTEFFPRGNSSIPIDKLIADPSKFAWKGQPIGLGRHSGVLPTTGRIPTDKNLFFASAPHSSATQYAGGGGVLARVKSHQFSTPLPKFRNGRQVLTAEDALKSKQMFYTGWLSQIDPRKRWKGLQDQREMYGHLKAGPDSPYETVGSLKKSMPYRWQVDGDVVRPGRVMANPREASVFQPLLKNIINQVDPKNIDGLTPYLGKSVRDIPKRMSKFMAKQSSPATALRKAADNQTSINVQIYG